MKALRIGFSPVVIVFLLCLRVCNSQDYDSAIVVGEMGCGKTLIGASVPYVYDNGDKPART